MKSISDTILLSIQPQFVDEIVKGNKTFEYRKKIPKHIKKVIVYATKPVGMVVGEFDVKQILTMEKEALWNITKDKSGITKAFYDSYFQNNKEANAIEITNFICYQKPLNDYAKTSPQSFCYVR